MSGTENIGSGGGGGGVCVLSGTVNSSWDRVGRLTLGAGGRGADLFTTTPSRSYAESGGDTSWDAVAPSITHTAASVITGGGRGLNNGDVDAASVGGVPFGLVAHDGIIGVAGWRVVYRANGFAGAFGYGGNSGGSDGATSLAFAGGAHGENAISGGSGHDGLPGGDGQFGSGGGGGIQGSSAAKAGGKGGDACMLIEWWL